MSVAEGFDLQLRGPCGLTATLHAHNRPLTQPLGQPTAMGGYFYAHGNQSYVSVTKNSVPLSPSPVSSVP